MKPKGLGSPSKGARGAKIGAYGLEGTGKTEFVMSATNIRRLYLVDTEGRSQYYKENHGLGFEVIYTKDVNDAIKVLEHVENLHRKGEKVAFGLDSFSSIWFEQQEVAARAGSTRSGQAKFQSWGIAKKPLKKFYSMLFHTPVDCIVTMRAKPKFEMESASKITAMGFNVPDTERGLGYAVDLMIEMDKEPLKPGAPLKPEDFFATVTKTSGPAFENPLPVGTVIRNPSFAQFLGLRLEGEGEMSIDGTDINLQIVKGTVSTPAQLATWIEEIGMDKDATLATLKEKHGKLVARSIPLYIDEVWAEREANEGEDS